MTIELEISNRGIREVLHFTTDSGAIGFLATRALIPRAELEQEQLLEYILKPNVDVRKDPTWTAHNSLSISRINSKFLTFSERQHGSSQGLWWCILAFDPIILTHDGVVFSTGNNIWPRARKQRGVDGLRQMFAPAVPGTYDSTIFRKSAMPDNVPTSFEAEVLYPGRVAIDFLTRAYFRTQDNADHFLALSRTLGVVLPEHVACVSPQRFP